MKKIAFISTGTTTSQSAVMASVLYEMVKQWIKDEQKPVPNFPLACIYDFSNMYSTLQYFASDKILMRMKELTSLIELLRTTKTQDTDWSRCSFPSKFVHKDTKNPLFFMIPVFPRGMTTELSKQEVIDLADIFCEISVKTQQSGTRYQAFDLPSIDMIEKNLAVVTPILLSNFIVGVIDCNKSKYEEMIKEVRTIQSILKRLTPLATTDLTVHGLIFNKVTEKAYNSEWFTQLSKDFDIPILGKINQDPQFLTVTNQFQIPTTEEFFHKMKSAQELANVTQNILKRFDDNAIREVSKKQLEKLQTKVFSL